MKITMIGSGYVGLVSGACFADFGHDVVCVDLDEAKIEALRGGKVPIFEPGLDRLMATNVEAGRLTFTLDLAEALDGADCDARYQRYPGRWHVFQLHAGMLHDADLALAECRDFLHQHWR